MGVWISAVKCLHLHSASRPSVAPCPVRGTRTRRRLHVSCPLAWSGQRAEPESRPRLCQMCQYTSCPYGHLVLLVCLKLKNAFFFLFTGLILKLQDTKRDVWTYGSTCRSMQLQLFFFAMNLLVTGVCVCVWHTHCLLFTCRSGILCVRVL